ncbi:DUF1818 family protein [Roseofilum casamattae]|uniref:DUF1818 family protein n=1 Tax=Roseofilum casamattae BLCC-M143 TaxID=3022442 RepID=A0ABT7C371_9CYAN|nr:DUF1818 family protein [Roseofilum casamattae]MDJ1185889.1 DUF1818 family protein [Roseofilum casamattae BLCC-M143]
MIREGNGWRVGWRPDAREYPALLAGADWAIELTNAELEEFCRLLQQLVDSLQHIAPELMDAEKITCEAEGSLIWMEVEGFPHFFSLHFILNTGRRMEGSWPDSVTPEVINALNLLGGF